MDGYKPKDIANGDETGLFFVHYQEKLCVWKYMCINNDYFVNKLSTFVFQNIPIVTL
jgi:hypothetical protein